MAESLFCLQLQHGILFDDAGIHSPEQFTADGLF
jgi:hypothetical protein